MAKKADGKYDPTQHRIKKRTSIGAGTLSRPTNKHKRRSFKKYRGQGLSSLMLRISSAFYFNRFLIPISAYIKESNIASIKSFEKAGYKFFNNITVNGFNTLVYKLEKI